MDIFYAKLDAHIQTLNEKFRAKYLIKRERYEEIILVLRDGWGDPQFKYWVQKHFMLVKVGELDVVYSRDKISRPVVVYEEVYTKLNECHNRVGHHGRDKTWHEVYEMKSFSEEKCIFLGESAIFVGAIRCCYDIHQVV
jgi:hypothetical protein